MRRLVIALSAARAVDTGGWTLIGYTGSFADARYGEFHITPDQVASWQRNLTAGVVTGEPGMVALDYEHAMDKAGASAGDMKASGWVKAIRLDGDRILAQIDWTPAARAAIEAGEFRYFSPTFADTYNNDQGADVGPTLIGGALTNRPFLRSKGALCVQLAQGGAHELEVPDEEELKTLGWTERLHKRGEKGTPQGGEFVKMVPGFDGTFDPEVDGIKPGTKVEFPSGAKGTFVRGEHGARGVIKTDKGDAGAWESGSATHDPGAVHATRGSGDVMLPTPEDYEHKADRETDPHEAEALRDTAKLIRQRREIEDRLARGERDVYADYADTPNFDALDHKGKYERRDPSRKKPHFQRERRGLSQEPDWDALGTQLDTVLTLGWLERLHPRQKGGPHAGEWVEGVHADRRSSKRDLGSLKESHAETRAAWEHAVAAAGPRGDNAEHATKAVELQSRMRRIDKEIKAANKAAKAAARHDNAERRHRDRQRADRAGMAFDLTQKLDAALELSWAEKLHPRAKKGDKAQHGGEWVKGINPSRRQHGPNTSGHTRRSTDRAEKPLPPPDRTEHESKPQHFPDDFEQEAMAEYKAEHGGRSPDEVKRAGGGRAKDLPGDGQPPRRRKDSGTSGLLARRLADRLDDELYALRFGDDAWRHEKRDTIGRWSESVGSHVPVAHAGRLHEDPMGKMKVGEKVSFAHPNTIDSGSIEGEVTGFDKISKEPWVRHTTGREVGHHKLYPRQHLTVRRDGTATPAHKLPKLPKLPKPEHRVVSPQFAEKADRLDAHLRGGDRRDRSLDDYGLFSQPDWGALIHTLDSQFNADTGGTPVMGYKPCPNCGATMRDDETTCASCGHSTMSSAPVKGVQSATSDTPTVNEFLRKLAQALGLDESASEDQVIARVAQLAQNQPDVRELAQKTGHVVLPAGQVATLTQQAQDGQDALAEVKVLSARLNLAEFESLMAQHPAAAPALRDTYKELWEQGQHDQVRKILSATPPSVRMNATGRAVTVPAGGDSRTGHMQLVQGTPLDRIGTLNIDEDRLELNQRTEALALAKNISYEEALDILTATGEAV